MKARLLLFFAMFLLMLISGVFWGTWFTLTRSIESFSPEEFIHIGKVIISNVALPMRIIMPAGILLMLLSIWFYRSKKTGFYFGLVSLVLIILVLLITLIVLVPIDNEIKTWTASTMPDNWEIIRDKWKTFHAMRTFISLTSFACFLIFILAGTDKENRNS
jgi:hypothetical protein